MPDSHPMALSTPRGRNLKGVTLQTAAYMTAAIVFGIMILILGQILWHGIEALNPGFLVDPPRNAGRAGGIGPIIVSTALVLAVCMTVALPIGLGTALLLAEFTSLGSRHGRLVRLSLDILAGVPSIVFGLFGNAFFCKTLGLGFSILSGGLTLSCMVLPILIRTTEAGFRAIQPELRLTAASLGFTRSAAILHLLLPAATPGLMVGTILGIGRAAAETAALIFTSGYVDRMPESLLDSGRTLALHIYDLGMNVAGGDRNAYATSLVLVLLLLAVNALASTLAHRWLQRRITAP